MFQFYQQHKWKMYSIAALFASVMIPTSALADSTWTTGQYKDNQDIRKTLSLVGASKLRVTVVGETEGCCDFLYVMDKNNTIIETLKGTINTAFNVSGDTINVRLYTDYSVVKAGVTISISDASDIFTPTTGTVQVQEIPRIMRENRWPLAADLMTSWFFGSGENMIIDIDEIMSRSIDAENARFAYENDSLIFRHDGADQPRQLLIKELKRTVRQIGYGNVIPFGGSFDHITTEIAAAGTGWKSLSDEQTSDMHWIGEKSIGSAGLTSNLNEFTAAFGEGVIRLLAKGYVNIDDGGVATVTVSNMAIYFRDSYDFQGFQYLGCWSRKFPYVAKSFIGLASDYKCVDNASFRAYNSDPAHMRKGADYRILSYPVLIRGNYPYEFKYQLTREEMASRSVVGPSQNKYIESFYVRWRDYFGTKLGVNYICFNTYTCQNFSNGFVIAATSTGDSVWWYNGNGWTMAQ